MIKIILKSTLIGTLIFFGLLGTGVMGLRPAFELMLLFSMPSLTIVGPVFGFLLDAVGSELEGPPAAVGLILLSSWLEIILIVTIVKVLFFLYKRSKNKSDNARSLPI